MSATAIRRGSRRSAERIEANPEQYQVLHRNIRHAITRHFPYGVFYRIRGSKISVFAVVHLHRVD